MNEIAQALDRWTQFKVDEQRYFKWIGWLMVGVLLAGMVGIGWFIVTEEKQPDVQYHHDESQPGSCWYTDRTLFCIADGE